MTVKRFARLYGLAGTGRASAGGGKAPLSLCRAGDPDGLGDEVDPDGAGDDRTHQVADAEPGAVHRRTAVDLGCLVLGPSFGDAVGDRLDQYVDRRADPLLGALRGELLRQRRHPRDPFRDDVRAELAVEPGGLGAVLVGVAEHADRV